jgi:hypothetical protein
MSEKGGHDLSDILISPLNQIIIIDDNNTYVLKKLHSSRTCLVQQKALSGVKFIGWKCRLTF